MPNKNLNISNFLSFLRILLVAPFFILLLNENDFWAIIVGIMAVITDFIDGWAARKFNMITDLGRILDPVGDKLLLAAAIIALLIRGDIPLWFFILAFSRDLVILLFGLYLKNKSGEITESNIWGKIAFALTSVVILGVIAELPYFYEYGFIISAILLVISSISYFIKFIKFQKILD